MPFEKGHKLSTGRPQGSKNKATDVEKLELQEIFKNFRNVYKK
tara:strand:- start:1296 stop:1424 length:129 start_codon:yes stop_codon:yes gene_type:complete